MSFNSQIFLLFFPLVYALYIVLRHNYRAQNHMLLLASYIFYGSWDWRFVSLLAFVTLINFYSAKTVFYLHEPASRRRIFIIAVSLNLCVLGMFKYLNFFADSFAQILKLVGVEAHYTTLNIVLPVGISFYIFQALGYLFDVYRRQLRPCRRITQFALYVSFFPQLVAGPIERAKNLLPQLTSPRKITLDGVNLGLYLILLGYFKKVVIADNLAQIADPIFSNYLSYQGLDIVIGVLAFTIQIYCDFSGYSDVARGLAKLLGIELMVNFRIPYFATSPRDFWRRWHISLSTWLRDYIYIPLGGNRGGKIRTSCNLGITMLLCGLWHGAGWNFVLWGAYHWGLLSIYRLFDGARRKIDVSGRIIMLSAVAVMFVCNFVGWIIFRSTSVEQILYMIGNMGLVGSGETTIFIKRFLFFASPLVIMEVMQYLQGNLASPSDRGGVIRSLVYGGLLAGIIVFGVREQVEFIYFQF